MAYHGGTLKSTSINGVKVYSLTGQHRSITSFTNPKKQRALRKDKDYTRRVELIQDLRFETATSKIKATPDGEFLIASGTYPPQVKVYELRELSLKFERHLDSEIVDFQVLSDDYSKLAFLCADRSVRLHAKYGSHYSVRIPRMGRDMAYDSWSCDLLCAASSPDLYRINLAQGRFLAPLTTQSPGLNVVSRSKLHGLVACGGEDGAVECFDMRTRSSIGRINTVSAADEDEQVTAIEFDEDGGFQMAVGSSDGRQGRKFFYRLHEDGRFKIRQALDKNQEVGVAASVENSKSQLKIRRPVITFPLRLWKRFILSYWKNKVVTSESHPKVLIYDLRSSHPIRVKDHMYGSPILDIKWHRTLNSDHPKLISTDNHIVRIWDPETGEGMTNIEPTGGTINDICVFRESGLMLLALDSREIPSYFIPTVGPAPKWCSYLENLTEELEENAETSIYDDYKFVTKEELEKLNLTNLIGTNLLRASMHGFLIDYRLYKKAKAIADPFAYDAYIEQRKKEKLEKIYDERITIKRRLPKVNRRLAGSILEDEAAEVEKDGNDVDTKKPSKKKKGLSSDILKDDRFADMFNNPEFEIDENSQEFMALHPIAPQKRSALVEEHFEPVMEDDMSSSDGNASSASEDEGRPDRKSHAPRLYEVKDERHAQAFFDSVSLAKEDALPLGERVAALQDEDTASRLSTGVKVGFGGSREISYVSRNKAKYQEDEDDKEARRNKRGVQSLGLKPTSYDRRSQGGGRGGRGRGRGNRGGGGRGSRGRGRGRGR